MYKIAHISDTHISFNDENKNGEKLIELLTEIKSKNCDHIIITGDLAENPEKKDFQYIKEIFSHFKLLDSSKLSIIPGNHDIFGGAPRGIMFFAFPTICRNINYKKNEEFFIEAFKETFPSNNAFPFLKIIDNIALIGINAIDRWSLKKNTEGSNGRIDKENYEKIKNILSSEEVKDKFKIILIHHHFDNLKSNEEYPVHNLWIRSVNRKMKLTGKKKIVDLFKKNKVNLVLHGHTHINQIYNIKGITFLNASASVVPITDDQIRKYNIITIPGENETEKSITIETIIL